MAIETQQSVSKESQAWIVSLACAQIILENQDVLEQSNKFSQRLKQTSQHFIKEVERSLEPDITAIFDECEETSQEILGAIEALSKAVAKVNPVNLDRLTKFIEKTGMDE